MAETNAIPAQHTLSWFERLKLNHVIETLNLQKYHVIEFIIAGIIGFVLGIAWRRYTHYVIAFVIFVIGLIVLTHFEFIKMIIDWHKIYEMFGIANLPADAGLFEVLWAWVKNNSVLVGCALIGFFIGTRVS